ncbi:MAG: hypothetical protein KatS3mg115_2252 [Candidatus Poribacteria bacterium]|nr:MAG: hypothetical protein KatS3mg115_2252 [Candidatus Poribacteria bacterium]
MKALVETILKALVDHPELVEVNEIVGTKSYTLELKVGPDDVGKIIGKRGPHH